MFQSLQDLCSAKKPVTCIKMVLVRGLERLSKWPPNMDLFPGLTVGGDFSSLQVCYKIELKNQTVKGSNFSAKPAHKVYK